MKQSFYVYLDMANNAFTIHGFGSAPFLRGIHYSPKNLLFLDPHETFGKYNATNGLHYAQGTEMVTAYFQSSKKSKQNSLVKWMDVQDVEMLNELTPAEISELLYFGHTTKSLHSPFFYKLQNNFAFFELPNHFIKVYFRYMGDFYQALAEHLRFAVFEQINSKKTIFQKKISVEKPSLKQLKELRSLLTLGVLFEINEENFHENTYRIPIFVIEDLYHKMEGNHFEKEDLIANLVYNTVTSLWTLERFHLSVDSQ